MSLGSGQSIAAVSSSKMKSQRGGKKKPQINIQKPRDAVMIIIKS